MGEKEVAVGASLADARRTIEAPTYETTPARPPDWIVGHGSEGGNVLLCPTLLGASKKYYSSVSLSVSPFYDERGILLCRLTMPVLRHSVPVLHPARSVVRLGHKNFL